MSIGTTDALAELRTFLASGRFQSAGALMTDLDGTAVLEREGRIYLPPEVELGLKRVHERGRPVIANTLRFPLSVITVFGADLSSAARRRGSGTSVRRWHAGGNARCSSTATCA